MLIKAGLKLLRHCGYCVVNQTTDFDLLKCVIARDKLTSHYNQHFYLGIIISSLYYNANSLSVDDQQDYAFRVMLFEQEKLDSYFSRATKLLIFQLSIVSSQNDT